MRLPVDASAALRFASPDDIKHVLVVSKVRALLGEGDVLCYTPQVARECWSVPTRPATYNGYGLTPAEASEPMRAIGRHFVFLDDITGIFETWRPLVEDHNVSGRQVHDANHMAALLTHGLDGILTLDERDLRRYPGIEIVLLT